MVKLTLVFLFQVKIFCLLILLKDGGIYADFDINMTVNLNSSVTPNLGFSVPLNFIAGHNNIIFCLRNRFMGKASGYLYIVKAIEHLLNVVLNYCKYYDVEHEVCQQSQDMTKVWKLQTLDILTLTGPCALGMPVNAAMNRDALAMFDAG